MYSLNSNIKFYATCRHRLNETSAKIFSECKTLFGNEIPKRSKDFLRLIETKKTEIDGFKQEKMEYLCIEDRNAIKTLKFDLNKIFEMNIPEKIAFYALCRYHFITNLNEIILETQTLFKDNVLKLEEFETLISNSFGVTIKKPMQLKNTTEISAIQKENKIIVANENKRKEEQQTIEIKIERIEVDDSNENVESIIQVPVQITYEMQEKIDLLIRDKEALKAELNHQKSIQQKQKLKSDLLIKHLTQEKETEANNNNELNEKLSNFSVQITEAINNITNLHNENEKLKEDNKNLIESKEQSFVEITNLEQCIKQLKEFSNIQRDKLISATSYIKCLQKNLEDLKKETDDLKINNYKLNTSRAEYLKFINESAQNAKNLKEKNDEIHQLNISNTKYKNELNEANERIKTLEREMNFKTNYWVDHQNTVRDMEMQIINLRSINLDLEKRLSFTYPNQYAANSFPFNTESYSNVQQMYNQPKRGRMSVCNTNFVKEMSNTDKACNQPFQTCSQRERMSICGSNFMKTENKEMSRSKRKAKAEENAVNHNKMTKLMDIEIQEIDFNKKDDLRGPNLKAPDLNVDLTESTFKKENIQEEELIGF